MSSFPLEIYAKSPQFNYNYSKIKEADPYKERKIALEIFKQIGTVFKEIYKSFENEEYPHFHKTDKLKINAFKLVREFQIVAGLFLYPFSPSLGSSFLLKGRNSIECYDEYLKGVENPSYTNRNLSKITLKTFFDFPQSEQSRLIERYRLESLESQFEKVKTFPVQLLEKTTLDDLYDISIYCFYRLKENTLLSEVNISYVHEGSNAKLDLLMELAYSDKAPLDQLPADFSSPLLSTVRRLTSDQINQLLKDGRFYDHKTDSPRDDALPYYAFRFFSIKQIQGIDLSIASPRMIIELLEVKDESTLKSCLKDPENYFPELEVQEKPDVNLDSDPHFIEWLEKLKLRLEEKEYKPSSVNMALTRKAEKKVKNYNPQTAKLPEGFTSTYGGNTKVLFSEDAPHLVFKHPKMAWSMNPGYKELFENMEARNRRADKVCMENNLYLFHVPKCKIIRSNHPKEFLLAQEKVELEEGSLIFQKSLWRALIYSRHQVARSFAKELLKQMATFICKMSYSDVKFDNFPLTKDGFMAPIDFDDCPEDAVTGITKGLIFRYHLGLFKYVPHEWFDEIAEHVSSLLSDTDRIKFQNQLPFLKLLVHSREQKIAKDLQFKGSQEPIDFHYNNVHLKGIEKAINEQIEKDKAKWRGLNIRKQHFNIASSPELTKYNRDNLRAALVEMKKRGKIARFKMIGDQGVVVF